MKHSFKKLKHFEILTEDNFKATIKDFLFDEERYKLRYLEADFGNIISHHVLLPTLVLKSFYPEEGTFMTGLTKIYLDQYPRPEDNFTISRKYEEELSKHYQLDNYWDFPFTGQIYPSVKKAPAKPIDEENLGTSLRSFNEVTGYELSASDGTLGRIKDMIVDDTDWQIMYFVVDTSIWPWGKDILLDIDFIDKISYANKQASVNMSVDVIKNAPEYDPSQPLDIVYEQYLHGYYERNMANV